MDDPGYMLLVKAAPGLGKTTLGVRTAELGAARGRRVAYAGPRHDFFTDLMAIARQKSQWYEWLPRQEGDEAEGIPHTCDWAEAINGQWLSKGYKGIDFCSKVCGWDYINQRCAWHAQKNRREPIVFIQHQHIALGHPLEFSVLIGDEEPLKAFMHEWAIPAQRVMLTGMDPEEPFTELLHQLRQRCDGDVLLHGPELLDALGGAANVKQICDGAIFPAELIEAPSIHNAYEASRVDYAHLPHLVSLLSREAQAALTGQAYPPRIWVGKGSLTLLLRHAPKFQLPSHVIWLDGTGNEHLYEELLGRPVKVIAPPVALQGPITVIADRANGKSSLVDGDGLPTAKVDEARRTIERVIADGDYTQPGLVTYQSLTGIDWVERIFGERVANFYGARGTNRLQEVDVLFVLGAPLPSKSNLQKIAAMLYFNRMRAFESPWTWQWIQYDHIAEDGQGRQYPAGGYWGDLDLQALVWQFREAEILQAAHRARPLLRKVPVYLMVNVPIPELPVATVTTSRDIFDAPEGVDLNAWLRFLAWLGDRESVTAQEIAAGIKVSLPTGIKYRDALGEIPGWCVAAVKSHRRGYAPKTAMRTKDSTYSLSTRIKGAS